MDAKRFDTWTRNRARRLSRRDALRLVGAGGAVAALPILESNALAQGPCSLIIHAETAGGPSAPTAYDGTLQFTLGPDGTFTQASFTGAQSVTGRATGRAIDFEVTFAGNQIVAFSGAGEQPFSSCQGAAAGLFGGPQPGDIGGWQTTGGQSTAGSGSTASGSGSTNAGGGSTSSCPPPQIACGQNCCPGGGMCTDANQGICACPDGTIQCGLSCVPECFDENESLNLDTCQCEANQEPTCVPDQGMCETSEQCCTQICNFGTCGCASFETNCGGICTDVQVDVNNCGECGFPCIGGNVCLGARCVMPGYDRFSCGPDRVVCGPGQDCIGQVCTDI